MAIIHPAFLDYIVKVLRTSLKTEDIPFCYDPLLQLAEYCITDKTKEEISFHNDFDQDLVISANENYKQFGILGTVMSYFQNPILIQHIEPKVERKVIALKKGYPKMPSTKMSIIIQGFGHELDNKEVLSIYASYGLAQNNKDMNAQFDFVDINRRIERLSVLIEKELFEECRKVHQRYAAIRSYVLSSPREKDKSIKESGIKNSLFFYYWKSFKQYGLLGLVDRGKKIFRETKVGLANEAKMVIDKLQYPDRKESYYINQLKYKGIPIDRSTVSRIFSRWGTGQYKSVFVSDLERLERDPVPDDSLLRYEVPEQYPDRLVDINMLYYLQGMEENYLNVSAPGLFTVWAYLEELEIFPFLDAMGLTGGYRGYGWFEHLLLNIGRIFYGIPCYSRTSTHEEPTLPFFCHLVSLPCNDTFIKGLASITQEKVFEIQKWLIKRAKELGFIKGKRLAFDFHHIDIDVEMDKLREFGKGPSPRKKTIYNGFRPHIVWDLDTGNLVIAEFRKASARGTTTVKHFVKDYLIEPLKDFFHKIYLDSEYTGKDVWNFILDNEFGMGAELVACIKQNPMVRKVRDAFLLRNENKDTFWNYYDDDHVYSSKTFPLRWEYRNTKSCDAKTLTLYCVVKKNIRSEKLRCFGTSKKDKTSKEILSDYSHRWIIENGIKDLISSYFLDKQPGTTPHQVNVHFLIIMICRQIFRMIQRDLGDFIKNADGSIKTMSVMRETLFRQGSSRVVFRNNTYEVEILNRFSSKFTKELESWFGILEKRFGDGMKILGGSKLKFILQQPYEKEHRNAMRKLPLDFEKFQPDIKI